MVAERSEAARIEALRPPDAVPEPEPEVIPPPRVTPRDLFALLRNHFAPDGNATTGLRETFHRFDDDGDGALTRVQFRDFVKSAIPDATQRELRHFEHLSVGDGDAPVSLNVLREALRGARAFKASKIRAAAVDPRAPAMPDRARPRRGGHSSSGRCPDTSQEGSGLRMKPRGRFLTGSTSTRTSTSPNRSSRRS